METYGKILLIVVPAFLILVLFEKWYGWKKGFDTVRNMDMISSLSSGVTNVLQSVTPDASLLLLFMFYTPMLNMGVDWDSPGGEQGDFVFYKLGPILISYGLCEKVISLNKIGEAEVWAIQTSDTGRKFFAWAEKYRTFEEYVNAKNKKSKTTTNKVHDNHVS